MRGKRMAVSILAVAVLVWLGNLWQLPIGKPGFIHITPQAQSEGIGERGR